MRIFKLLLAVVVGLQALLYALQNVVNLEQAHSFVATVLAMRDHGAYPHHFGPAIESSALAWCALWIIIAGELLAGLLCFKGAFDMARSLRAPGAEFQHAKRHALVGCGVAVLVWFGLFMAIGGAYFQMWQTEMGIASLEGAFMYTVSSGLALVIIHLADD